MDQENPSESQTQEDNSKGAAALGPQTAASAADPAAAQAPAPARPRRPQRSAKVEGSIDISEPKSTSEPEPKDVPAAVSHEKEFTTDGAAASQPKPSRLAGPKGPGHHPVRAASVPHPAASSPVPPHLNPHALRALSVAATADTQAQTMEDFRQVPRAVCLPTVMSVYVSAARL